MRRDEQAIIRTKLDAENALRTMVEKLISLGVAEKEIMDAVEHAKHEGLNRAIFELSKKR